MKPRLPRKVIKRLTRSRPIGTKRGKKGYNRKKDGRIIICGGEENQ